MRASLMGGWHDRIPICYLLSVLRAKEIESVELAILKLTIRQLKKNVLELLHHPRSF